MSESVATARKVEPVRPVIVGVDGSDNAKAALSWAVEYARSTGIPLVAVATWEWPTSYGAMVPWPDNVNFEDDARTELDQTVRDVLGKGATQQLTTEVVHGPPSAVLEAMSSSASLLVVGSRGHGEIAGMLLGSVSEFLVTHAHCPVVVVRSDDQHSH